MPKIKDLAVRLATGAVAGAVATWAMKKVTEMIETAQDADTRVEEAFAEKKPAEDVLIDRASKRMGVKLSRGERRRAAQGLKWGLGVANGVAMAWLRRRMGATGSLARGALFGAVTFLLVDEMLKPAVGMHRNFSAIPWQTHARGLAGHATYGLVDAGVRRAIGRMLPAQLGA